MVFSYNFGRFWYWLRIRLKVEIYMTLQDKCKDGREHTLVAPTSRGTLCRICGKTYPSEDLS